MTKGRTFDPAYINDLMRQLVMGEVTKRDISKLLQVDLGQVDLWLKQYKTGTLGNDISFWPPEAQVMVHDLRYLVGELYHRSKQLEMALSDSRNKRTKQRNRIKPTKVEMMSSEKKKEGGD